MVALVWMESTVTIALAVPVILDLIVNIKLTNVILNLVAMEQPVMNKTMTTLAIALMDTLANNAMTTSIGALKCPVKMEQLVYNTKTNISAHAHQAGLGSFVMWRWYLAKMLPCVKE